MIRYLKNEEKRNIIPLYTMCFDDTEKYCDYYFGKRLPNNEVAVCEENNEIQGMIHLIPKTVVCGRYLEKVEYLYAVATTPIFRRQGVMGKILGKVLRDLKDRGDGFTYLVPSSKENAQIYQKYGFARVMDKCEYRLPVEGAACSQTPCLELTQVEGLELENLNLLCDFAQRVMAERYIVYINRDRQYFEEMMELMEADDGEIQLYLREDEIKGYRIGSAEEILEEVWADSLAEEARRVPYAMARILNIPKVLDSISTNEMGCIYIEVTDSVIKENNGVFLWEFSPEGNHWEKKSHKPDVRMRVEEFCAYLFGYDVHYFQKVRNHGNVTEEVFSSDDWDVLRQKLPQLNIRQGFYINDYV